MASLKWLLINPPRMASHTTVFTNEGTTLMHDTLGTNYI